MSAGYKPNPLVNLSPPLGVPPMQADERDPVFLRHLFEDPPMAPFLALKHRPWVFTKASQLAAAPFFEAMSRDPIAFLATVGCSREMPSPLDHTCALVN